MNAPTPGSHPTPNLFFDTLNGYQRTAALKAALDLNVFTSIGTTPSTAEEVAARSEASVRGIRILCDYLTICGFLVKTENRYALTADSAAFLDRNSPMYCGDIADFLLADTMKQSFEQLTGAVRKGGSVSEEGTTATEHEVWLKFARGMGKLMTPTAYGAAALVTSLSQDKPSKILDISASHGTFGIALAQQFPQAHLVALDWEPVLAITQESADVAGLSERFSTIAGNAFTIDFGTDYDVILIPNFLHHFNAADCTRFLAKTHAALRPGGQVVIVEFVPNADRVSPPPAAGFSLVMLGTTPEGDAYTFAEFQNMLKEAGFASAEFHPLPPTAESAILATKGK